MLSKFPLYKKIIFVLAFSFFCSLTVSSIHSDPKSELKDTLIVKENAYLEIKARIDIAKGNNDAVFVILMDTNRVASFKTEKIIGKTSFRLPYQHNFTIRVKKPGYYTKFITIDTHVPKKSKKFVYFFDMTVDLMKEMKKLDASIFKKPIAEIVFDSKADAFVFDPAYTESLKEDIEKLKKNYLMLDKVEQDIKKQDSLEILKKDPK